MKKFDDYIEDTIMSGDFSGVKLPLLGLIRRPYANAIGSFKKRKKKKKKREYREDYGSVGLPDIKRTFPQPTMVSVHSMTKKSFKNIKRRKRKFVKNNLV